MYRRILAAAIACAALAAPSSASAAGLAVTPVTPANGSAYTVTLDQYGLAPRFTYEVDWPSRGADALFYEVATQTTLGPDGTLANEFVVSDGDLMVTDAAAPTRYKDDGFAEWMTKPGTYYMQLYSYVGCTGEWVPCTSELSTITVNAAGPPTPPAPTPQAPTGDPAPPAPPAGDEPSDRKYWVYMSNRPRVGTTGLRFIVECVEDCIVGTWAEVRAGGRKYRFRTREGRIRAGQERGFRLPLSAAGYRAVRRAVRAGQRPRVRLQLAVYKPSNDMFEPFDDTFRIYG